VTKAPKSNKIERRSN